VIISRDPDRPKAGRSAESIAVDPIWNGLQESLKRLSPQSRRIIARGSGHHVMIDRPDVAIAAAREVIIEIREHRKGVAPGTTVVE